MKNKYMVILLFGVALGLAPNGHAQDEEDKIISTKTIVGALEGFDQDDFVQAAIKTKDKVVSFLLGGEECFLALNRDQKLTITYHEIERFIMGIDEYVPLNEIQSITTHGTKKKWTRENFWKYDWSEEELEKCQSIMDELQVEIE